MERVNFSKGVLRGVRRARRSLGNLVLKLFRLDVMVRGSLRSRFLERGIEKGYRDLGEFIYTHAHQMETMEEGDLVLMDLMRTEIVRLAEEKKLLRKNDPKR